MLQTAWSFRPTYIPNGWGLTRTSRVMSSRFPFVGGTTNSLTIGINGTSTTYVPIRTALELAAWGATHDAWCYADRAVAQGYASINSFVAEVQAVGCLLQATTNSAAIDENTGPFALDIAGYPFESIFFNSNISPRPTLLSGVPRDPLLNRQDTPSYGPVYNTAHWNGKQALVDVQVAAGCTALQHDDPRAAAGFAGFTADRLENDLTSQTADYSAAAITGFPAWLAANTTAAQRTACGLPSDPTGLDYKAFLVTNFESFLKAGPGGNLQVDAAALDGHLFRTSVRTNANLRTHQSFWATYMRKAVADQIRDRATRSSVPMSLNMYAASPQDYMLWIGRLNPQPVTFVVTEIPPPYWDQISAYTVGSSDFHNARWLQCGRQSCQIAMSDMVGLFSVYEIKPTAPNQAPPRVLKQILRHSQMQVFAEGHLPIFPTDVYLANAGTRDQGTDVYNYRFWGAVADYKDVWDFITQNAQYVEGYEKLAAVHVVCSSSSFPFYEGATEAKFDALSARFGELFRRDIGFHMMVVGNNPGSPDEPPKRTVETNAPIIIRVQNDGDYGNYMGSVSGPKYRGWSTATLDEAMDYIPVRSTNDTVRAFARYNAQAGRVSVHLVNYAMNTDGTPKPETTILRWNRRYGSPVSVANVVRLGEAPGTVDMTPGYAQVTLREYAIVNFAVTP